MGKRSALAKRMDTAADHYLNTGMNTGIQYAADCIQLAALEAKVSTSTIAWIIRRADELMDEHHPALDARHPLADVHQEKIDRMLERIWKEELTPFDERFDMMKKVRY